MRTDCRFLTSFWLSILLASSLTAADSPAKKPPAEELAFFEKKIRPVLVEHCYGCHSSQSKAVKGGLLVDTRAGIRAGGDSGPAVVPRDTEDSLLLSAMRHESFEMPPKRKLPDSVIADFERWIRRGAVDPREGKAAARSDSELDERRSFWAFQPWQTGPPPAVQQTDWPATPIDHYVLAKLEAAGLTPAKSAAPRELVRRLYYDLTGLPPSPAELQAYLDDPSPDRYQRLVDRLLSSPHFGERWGRHWLDVVRYAESVGGGRTRIFFEAWRYRDYVVASFNDDVPYDRFLTEQVAGDLLERTDSLEQNQRQLIATAFLVLGAHNYELQDKELLRMEVVDEQIDTLGRAALGMTIGCARCHDHKFDPIPTRDYYALAGIFRSTKSLVPGNVSGFVQTPLPMPADRQARYDAHQAQLAELKKELAAAQKGLGKQAAGTVIVAADRLPGLVQDELQAVLEGEWKTSTSVKAYVDSSYHHATAGAATASYSLNVPEDGRYEVRVSHSSSTNRASNVPVSVYHAEGETKVSVNQRRKAPIDGLFVSLGTFAFKQAEPARVVIHCEGVNGVVIADAVQLLPTAASQVAGKASKEAAKDSAASARQRQLAMRAKQLTEQIKTLEKESPPAPPLVMSVQDESQTEDFNICVRGNVHQLGRKVPRGFLQVASSNEPVVIPTGQSGRLQVAHWLGSPHNPLTGRVIANRVWQHLLGEGLVRTPDNFGAAGEPPSHPLLLDHLASRLVQDQWSLKSLIRQIVCSRVYQLSTAPDPASQNKDPENRLLARGNRRRVDAEYLRDAVLAISGQLDRRLGGATIDPGTKSEFTFEYKSSRRSIYVPVLRNAPHDLLDAFDVANPNLVSGRRTPSVLPSQALYLLNSPFMMRQSRLAARRLLARDESDAERLDHFYELTLGRAPSARETALSQAFLKKAGVWEAGSADEQKVPAAATDARLQAWSRVCHAVLASLDFRYVD